jgi:hypothetical protein
VSSPPTPVTQLLLAWSKGDRDALEDLLPVVYAELRRIAGRYLRHGRVELRFFGGLTIEETGEAMGLSPATVKRQWAVARAWLLHSLNPETA